jgi:hypothetical protein
VRVMAPLAFAGPAILHLLSMAAARLPAAQAGMLRLGVCVRTGPTSAVRLCRRVVFGGPLEGGAGVSPRLRQLGPSLHASCWRPRALG